MELCMELLIGLLARGQVTVQVPAITEDVFERFNTTCYQMLKEIKAVLENKTYSDEAEFMKIEEILEVFDEHGCSCDSWHDELE